MNKQLLRKFLFSHFFILLLFFCSLFPILELVKPGLPVTHDGQDHIARIANFYQSLSEGNVIPRWGANLNWGYGHPVLMFLYPLPSYIASFFHYIGFSFVDSTKLVFALTYILSMMTMYIFLNSLWGNKSAFIGAIIYGFAPYRFVDIYVRGALGEQVSFVFIPIIFWGVYKLRVKRSIGVAVTSLGIACLALSHNAVLILVLPVLTAYVFYLYTKENSGTQYLLDVAIALCFGFGLSSFFLFPAFYEGKYTLRDIVTGIEVLSRFTSWSTFVYSPWNYGGTNDFTKSIGIASWVILFSAVVLYWRGFEKKRNPLLGGLIFFIFISLFMMTKESLVVWEQISILQKFQFPWRFLVLTTFLCSVLSGLVTFLISDNKRNIIFIVLFSTAILSTIHMWKANTIKIYKEDFFFGTYDGTTDTGESSPIWSVRFMEKRPSFPLEIIKGNAKIIEISRTTTTRTYEITAYEKTRLVENTLYFPGWRVLIDNQSAPIQFQDPIYRGLQTFLVEPGSRKVIIEFKNTKIRTITEIVTIISIMLLTLYYFYLKKYE